MCLHFSFFNSYMFHYVCQDGVIILCITDDVSINILLRVCTFCLATYFNCLPRIVFFKASHNFFSFLEVEL